MRVIVTTLVSTLVSISITTPIRITLLVMVLRMTATLTVILTVEIMKVFMMIIIRTALIVRMSTVKMRIIMTVMMNFRSNNDGKGGDSHDSQNNIRKLETKSFVVAIVRRRLRL